MANQIPMPLGFNSVRNLLLEVCKKSTDAMGYVQSIPQSMPLHKNPQCLDHYSYLHELLISLHSDCVALVSYYYDLQQKCTCAMSRFVENDDTNDDALS